jgi:hypothetical protein
MASPTNSDPAYLLMKELVAVQRENLTWTKFNARRALEETLRATLKDARHQAAYELSNGERTQTEVGASVGLDQSTISQLWGRWRRLGLLQDDTGGRPKHLIALEDLGWDVALLPKATRARSKDKTSVQAADAEEPAVTE